MNPLDLPKAIGNAVSGKARKVEKPTKQSDKKHKPRARDRHVDVYAEFFGALTPAISPDDNVRTDRTIATSSDEYRWSVTSDGFIVSHEMLRELRPLIADGRVHWHWVSAYWPYNANFDEACGFPAQLTSAKDYIASDSDKLKVIKKAIKRESRRDKNHHDIIWIDSSIDLERPGIRRQAKNVKDAHIRMLTIAPKGGLRRSEVHYLIKFVNEAFEPRGDKKNRRRQWRLRSYSARSRTVTTIDNRAAPHAGELFVEPEGGAK